METETTAKHACCCAQRPENSSAIFGPREIVAHVGPQSTASSVALKGGAFLMGTDYTGGFPEDGEGPVREVELDPFSIDVHPVTNARFQEFVQSTGYRTDAERYEWSFVFAGLITPELYPKLVVDTVAAAPWWCVVQGAMWKHPEGPQSDLNQRWDHPVVHVSWNDATAFCAWSQQRLPTEAEWEFAARGGLEQRLYAWGDTLLPEGRHMCNIWQGTFPAWNSGEDGFQGTCPVDAFPPNGYGLHSVAGNVWEWCADWFSPDHQKSAIRMNPKGPPSGSGKVMKGGSFLCHESYCNRYRVAARTMNSPDSSTSNIGFRCAGTEHARA